MASALVQMTAFSPCSQLGDMIMIGMEASLESFPGSGSRDDGNKRSHSDGEEEQDRGHVKKRRKQSKPIRITATDALSDSKALGGSSRGISDLDFSETGEHFLTEGLVEVSGRPTEEYEGLSLKNQEPNKIYQDNLDKRIQGEKTFDSILPLNLSNIKNSFMDSLIVPDVSEIQISSNKHISMDNNMPQFQSTSHENSKNIIAQENSYISQSPSLLLPLFKQNQIQSQISSQMRIFNPEAFCDLCNKEFCNKYFLKTHKANKHGIYTEIPSGPTLLDPMPSLPFTSYFSTNNETYESPPSFQMSSISKSLFSLTSYSASRTVPKKSQVVQQPQQSSLYSIKSNSSGNMRALCNICQREFCNKYFVRKHKLKIHGIIEPIPKDGSTADTHESNSLNNNTSQDKLDIPSNETEMYSGYAKQFMPSNFNINVKEVSQVSQSVDLSSEKCNVKQEKESESDTQAPQVSHNVPTPSESISISQVSLNEENNKENDLSSLRLKKLGIINADAFCDICCKEYCNKYFLRTHKLKSHGILPVEEKRDDAINGTTSNINWYQTQTTPLNLIMSEATVNRDVSDKLCFDTEAEECACDICGRYFQSQFLLKMHQAYTHPNKYIASEALEVSKQNSTPADNSHGTKDVNGSESLHKQSLENYLTIVKSEYSREPDECENKTIVNAESLQKLQTLISRLNNPNMSESSLCEVCEKDVGHVSLLENHILKEHAVLLEEMGNITEEDNSSSQSSLAVSTYSFKKECPHCQKLFFKPFLLEQHINDAHSDLDMPIESENLKESSDLKDINNPHKMSLAPFTTQSLEDRQGLQTPTSSFCEICKKELCNKYFMKTHMLRMHGISIENGAQIGGVVCDICNKELCSKYFLRVHKQNSHGIVDELLLPQLGLDFLMNQSPNTDPALKPTDQADLTHRYFTHFNEVCTICNRRFRSVKWLKAHLWNDHGEEGKERWKEVFTSSNSDSKIAQFEENSKDIGKAVELSSMFSNTSNLGNMLKSSESNQNGKDVPDSLADKNILNNTTMFSMLMNGKDSESKHYQCSYCSFTTTILAFLFIHERSHTNNRSFHSDTDYPFQCPICFQNMDCKENFEKHLKSHKMPWQQPYSSNGSQQEFVKAPVKKSETKNDLSFSKERVVQQDQEVSEHVSFTSHYSVKPKPSVHNSQLESASESSVRCTRCGLNSNNIQEYLDHVHKEHPFLQMDQELPSYLHQVEKALSSLACNAGIPAVFAAPQTQDQVMMQPFVLEDSEYISDTNNSFDPKPGKTFLSSLVFLPVKEKLKKSVTASFKLTPT